MEINKCPGLHRRPLLLLAIFPLLLNPSLSEMALGFIPQKHVLTKGTTARACVTFCAPTRGSTNIGHRLRPLVLMANLLLLLMARRLLLLTPILVEVTLTKSRNTT